MAEQRDIAEYAAVESPVYPRPDGRVVVRRFGSERTHVGVVEPEWATATKWIGPAYWAIHDPLVTACGAVLRPDHRGLIVMRPETRPSCPRCKRLSQYDGSRAPGGGQ